MDADDSRQFVIPAEAGIQKSDGTADERRWTPMDREE
jgi:hypothetical protein